MDTYGCYFSNKVSCSAEAYHKEYFVPRPVSDAFLAFVCIAYLLLILVTIPTCGYKSSSYWIISGEWKTLFLLDLHIFYYYTLRHLLCSLQHHHFNWYQFPSSLLGLFGCQEADLYSKNDDNQNHECERHKHPHKRS